MSLEEINRNEIKQNLAFKKWLSSMDIGDKKTQDLTDYVAGLNRDIADLQSLINNKGE